MKALAALAVAALLAVGAIACSDDDNIDDGTGIGDTGGGDIESAPLARTPLGDSSGSLNDPAGDTDDETVVVSVESSDDAISIGQATIRAGKVTFEITNEGLTATDFHVLKTEARAAALPMDTTGEVDIEGSGIDVVESVEGIQPGVTETVTIDLETGHYVILSDNEDPHSPGLGTDVTVSQSPA